jgi:hypothetical protein
MIELISGINGSDQRAIGKKGYNLMQCYRKESEGPKSGNWAMEVEWREHIEIKRKQE